MRGEFSFGGWRVEVQDRPYSRRAAVWIIREVGQSGEILQGDGTFVKIELGDLLPKPTIEIDSMVLQAFADALHERGIRPKQRRFENEMDLVKAHLQDMRRLVFNAPKGGRERR